MRRSRRNRILLLGVGSLAGLSLITACASGSAGTGQASQGASSPGVAGSSVTVGYIGDQTGALASASANSLAGFKARIDRQNAEGGVDGRKIVVISKDDGSSAQQNASAAQVLVQQDHVFLVAEANAFAFGGAPYLSAQGIPVIGAPYDGPEWGTDRNMFGVNGSPNPKRPAFTTFGTYFKDQGVTSFASLGYGSTPASALGAKAIAKSVSAADIKVSYLNTSVQIGSSFQSEAIAIKNSGANGIFANFDTAAVLRLLTALKQVGVHMKASLFPTGYGQALLNQPQALAAAQGASFVLLWKPAELDDAATQLEESDLKKYADFTGVPGFDYTYGWLAASLTITALQAGGKEPTRASVMSGLSKITGWTGEGMTAGPVSFAPSAFGKADAIQEGGGNCIYTVTVKGSQFTLPSRKPICGTEISDSDQG
jgi:branched-chain amino acid transport system substrate-binding protein